VEKFHIVVVGMIFHIPADLELWVRRNYGDPRPHLHWECTFV